MPYAAASVRADADRILGTGGRWRDSLVFPRMPDIWKYAPFGSGSFSFTLNAIGPPA